MLTCLVQKLCTPFLSEFSSVRFIINLHRWGKIILREGEIHVRTTYPGIWKRMVGITARGYALKLGGFKMGTARAVQETRRPNEWSSCSRKHFMQICPSAMSLVLSKPRGNQRPTFRFRALLKRERSFFAHTKHTPSSVRALRFFRQIIKYYI